MNKGTLNLLISIMAFLVVITLTNVTIPEDQPALQFLRFAACAITMVFTIIITSCKKITDDED